MMDRRKRYNYDIYHVIEQVVLCVDLCFSELLYMFLILASELFLDLYQQVGTSGQQAGLPVVMTQQGDGFSESFGFKILKTPHRFLPRVQEGALDILSIQRSSVGSQSVFLAQKRFTRTLILAR